MGAEQDRFVKKAALTNWRSFKLTHRAAIRACLNEHDWTGLITARDGAARPGRVPLEPWEKTKNIKPISTDYTPSKLFFFFFLLHLILSTCRFVRKIINCKVLQKLNLHKLFRFSENKPLTASPWAAQTSIIKPRSVRQDNLQKWYINALIMHSGAKWNIKPSGSSGGA